MKRPLLLGSLPVFAVVSVMASGTARSSSLDLPLRRGETINQVSWQPSETAVIICDMWDGTALLVRHIEKFWCPSLASDDLIAPRAASATQ